MAGSIFAYIATGVAGIAQFGLALWRPGLSHLAQHLEQGVVVPGGFAELAGE
jgi:hypothetical protein